jgi:hypothetical protein
LGTVLTLTEITIAFTHAQQTLKPTIARQVKAVNNQSISFVPVLLL